MQRSIGLVAIALLLVACGALAHVELEQESFKTATGHVVQAYANTSLEFEYFNNPGELTEVDFLRQPFDMTDKEDQELYDWMLAQPGLPAFRAAQIRTRFHMSVEDYDAQHEQSRKSLLEMAERHGVPVSVDADSFDDVMARLEIKLERLSAPAFLEGEAEAEMDEQALAEAYAQVAVLRESRSLFGSRPTLKVALLEDAVTHSVSAVFDGALTNLINGINAKKCAMCTKVAKWLINKACSAFGSAICGLLVGWIPGVGLLLKKFGCGKPLNLSRVFAGWCVKAIEWLMKKLGIDPSCPCNFTVPTFTVPRIKILFVTLLNKRVVSIGKVCNTPCKGIKK